MRSCTRKLFCIFAGIFGGLTYTCYAAGAHISGFYDVLAPIFLGNSLALLILSFLPLPKSYTAKAIGYGMIIGVLLFSLDLSVRQFWGHRLFPYAAPTGGMIMIISWFSLAFLALELKKINFDIKKKENL